jgi:hypothetical protein
MTLRHHLVTMTIGECLAKTNQITINVLIAFVVWIMFFHSTSCNAFVLGVQAFQSPKTPSKIDSYSFKTISKYRYSIDKKSQIDGEESLILFTNNGPAISTSSFLQLPNNNPAITTLSFLQHPYDSPAKQRPVPNDDNPAITTSSFLQFLSSPN